MTKAKDQSKPKEAETPAVYPLQIAAGAELELTTTQDTYVQVDNVTEKYVQLRVLPLPMAVERLLNRMYGPMGWDCRRYACGGTLYCSVGVYNPLTGEYLHKDAPAVDDYAGKNKAKAQAASSFVHAAEHWGVCADVLGLPVMTFTAQQMEIYPIAAQNDSKRIVGYRLRPALTVDKFARDDAGNIVMVQMKDQDEKVYVWPGQ